MAFEFHILSDKITQLADLTQQLRRENADLRLQLTALTEEKSTLSERIKQASSRIGHLLERLPAKETSEEVA